MRAVPTVGPEQEYFLVDKTVMLKRADLTICGRSLYGNEPSKGQSMSDHYFGLFNERISKFMMELDGLARTFNYLLNNPLFLKFIHLFLKIYRGTLGFGNTSQN